MVYFVSSTVLAVQCFGAFRYGIGRDLAVGFLFLLLVHLSRSRELAWVGTVHYSVINIRRWAAPNLGRPALSARGGPAGSAQPDGGLRWAVKPNLVLMGCRPKGWRPFWFRCVSVILYKKNREMRFRSGSMAVQVLLC